jgi:hypothetical protein
LFIRSIISAVIKVSELRNRKATASQKNFTRKEVDPTEKVDNAVKELEEFLQKRNLKEILLTSLIRANQKKRQSIFLKNLSKLEKKKRKRIKH